jgi:cobyric acid synthase
MVIGTYLHGLFGNPNARNALLSCLYAGKGLEFIPPSPDGGGDPYDQLAEEFERYVRLDPILSLF